MTPRPAQVSYQGHYAGSVTRFTAYAIDLVVSSAVFSLALAAISYVAQVVTGHSVHWNRSSIVVAVIFVLWEFAYFGYSWAVSGRTFGMAALGICVVRADGSSLEPRQGMVRALVFPLSFLLCGLGFLGILVQREHRALHDLIAGTAVVYSWDARAARLRFLARQAELAPGGSTSATPPDGLSPRRRCSATRPRPGCGRGRHPAARTRLIPSSPQFRTPRQVKPRLVRKYVDGRGEPDGRGDAAVPVRRAAGERDRAALAGPLGT